MSGLSEYAEDNSGGQYLRSIIEESQLSAVYFHLIEETILVEQTLTNVKIIFMKVKITSKYCVIRHWNTMERRYCLLRVFISFGFFVMILLHFINTFIFRYDIFASI